MSKSPRKVNEMSDGEMKELQVIGLPQQMNQEVTQAEAFEMIELATSDLSALTRAFEVISAVCKGDCELQTTSEESQIIQ